MLNSYDFKTQVTINDFEKYLNLFNVCLLYFLTQLTANY